MKKIKKINRKIKLSVALAVAAVILVVGFTVVSANMSFLDKIAQYAGQIIGNNLTQKLTDSGVLDTVGLDTAGEEFGGPISPVNWELNNGDLTYHLSGDFINSSTTIVSVTSPFLAATSSASDVVVKGSYPNGYTVASSTVDLLRLNITGVATSTFTVACGASATSGYNGAPSNAYTIIASGDVATSTNAVIENNLTNSYGSNVTGASVAKIGLGPKYPYLTCVVTTSYTGAFTDVGNTFDGTFVMRISKNQ